MDPTTNPYMKRMQSEAGEEYEFGLAVMKENAPKNLFFFNRYVLEVEKGDQNYVELGKFHRQMCNFIDDNKNFKKLLLIPRGHLKTKLITIGYSTQQICKNNSVRILIYSATWQMAVDMLAAIKANLQGNENLIELFGNLSIDAPEWAADRIRIKDNSKREPTVTAAGIDNNLVGGHYDIIIMDDVVNDENVNTMDQIEKVKGKYRAALDLLEPNGELIIIGTRWHDADLYGWLLDSQNQASTSFKTMVKTAYEGNLLTGEDFVPLWENKFDIHILRERLKNQGWSHFSAQYLNNPVPEEDATFKRSWIKYYEKEDLRGRLVNMFLAIDPAISTAKEADYTGMVVVGVDEENFIYIIDLVRRRLSPNDILNEIFRLRDWYNLIDIGIEQVAFQKALAYALREDPRFKRRPFHIVELKPQERSKDQRIKALQPLYENGKIYHNQLLPDNIYLEDELVRFPRSTHDDLLDALSYTLDFIFPSRQPQRQHRSTRYLY